MRSMTGFGKGEAMAPDGTVFSVELSSVNRKQLEIRISLPAEFSELDTVARRILGSGISRGAVSLKLTRSHGAGNRTAVRINQDLFQQLAESCVEIRTRFGLSAEFDPATLFAVPGVLENQTPDLEQPGLVAAFEQAVQNALQAFLAMRNAEGEALRQDLAGRMDFLRNKLNAIRPFAAGITERIKQRLLEKLEAENLAADPHDERLLRELLFYADRADVTEEITRLESHFGQFASFLNNDHEPVGRSLDFLVQEMFREITTLGNKAGSSDISPLVVAFKAELEKIREQVQNLE